MPFQPGNKYGGAREGAGRKLQPSAKALRKMKKYIDFMYVQDFKIMAQLSYNPEKYFGSKVQFAGKEEDSMDKEGKQSQSRTGSYQLDPLLKAQFDFIKFRCGKFLPDAPKEIEELAQELKEELSLRTVQLTQNIQINNNQPALPSPLKALDIQPTTDLPSVVQPDFNTQQNNLSFLVNVKSSDPTTPST